jgi:TonB family protein
MKHGTQAFFEERARSQRRVALLSVVVGGVLFAGIAAFQIAGVRKAAKDTIPILRFGIAGEKRIVPLVRIEAAAGLEDPLRDVGDLVIQRAGGGRGVGQAKPGLVPKPAEHTGPRIRGPGDEAHDLVTRALQSQGRVPIFQSEELVIEHLVRPEYPAEMREQGVEGKVSVIALIDTAGRVVDAEVMNASGSSQLDRAAEVAVRQCLFRPYLQEGARREVYAVFRFAFRIY